MLDVVGGRAGRPASRRLIAMGVHEGQVVGECVECPLHGRRFRLEDGAVERGPSGYRQPVFEVRVEGGRIAVREA